MTRAMIEVSWNRKVQSTIVYSTYYTQCFWVGDGYVVTWAYHDPGFAGHYRTFTNPHAALALLLAHRLKGRHLNQDQLRRLRQECGQIPSAKG